MDADELFEHLCELHVPFESCSWGHSCVERDLPWSQDGIDAQLCHILNHMHQYTAPEIRAGYRQVAGGSIAITCPRRDCNTNALQNVAELLTHLADHYMQSIFDEPTLRPRCRWGECLEISRSPEELEQHLAMQHISGYRPFVCSTCLIGYASKNLLRDHKQLLEHDPNGPNIFRCLWHGCSPIDPTITTVQKLREHVKAHFMFEHMSENMALRRCRWDGCERIFYKGSATSFLSHFSRHHVHYNAWVCPTCFEGFSTRKYLMQHHDARPGHCGDTGGHVAMPGSGSYSYP